MSKCFSAKLKCYFQEIQRDKLCHILPSDTNTCLFHIRDYLNPFDLYVQKLNVEAKIKGGKWLKLIIKLKYCRNEIYPISEEDISVPKLHKLIFQMEIKIKLVDFELFLKAG